MNQEYKETLLVIRAGQKIEIDNMSFTIQKTSPFIMKDDLAVTL
ncbi:hypothetical protein [Fulvivirga marina]|nr:hypothetical protein [Fulvivirga marina]